MLSGTESVKGARAPAAAVEIQSPVGWGRGSWEQLCAARAAGCGSVVRCVSDSKMEVHAPANLASSPTQADRRRQSRAGRSGVARACLDAEPHEQKLAWVSCDDTWQFTTEYAISILGPTPRGLACPFYII